MASVAARYWVVQSSTAPKVPVIGSSRTNTVQVVVESPSVVVMLYMSTAVTTAVLPVDERSMGGVDGIDVKFS